MLYHVQNIFLRDHEIEIEIIKLFSLFKVFVTLESFFNM